MGTLDLRYDAVKKEVSLSGIQRLDSNLKGLRAVAATVVIFYQDDDVHNLQGSNQANHENVPSTLSFIPAPEIISRGLGQRRGGAQDGAPLQGGLWHPSKAAGVSRVSFSLAPAGGGQEVSAEERMDSADCIPADTSEIQAAYLGYGCAGHPCDSAGYEDVEMTSSEHHPPDRNGEDADVVCGSPVQIKEEPLSPDHISITDEGEVLQPFPDNVQICEVRTLHSNTESGSRDGAGGSRAALGAAGTAGGGYEVQELKQEDDSDLESLPLHFLTEQAPSCSVNLDLGESACGNPYESIMTDSVDLTDLPVTPNNSSSDKEASSVSSKESSAPALRPADSVQRLNDDMGGKKGDARNDFQECSKVEESASLSCAEQTEGREGSSASTTPEADFTCGTSKIRGNVRPRREPTRCSAIPETEESLRLSSKDGADDGAGERASQDTAAGGASDASASDQVELIDLCSIKKEAEPEDCCIVGVTPGRAPPPAPTTARSLASLPARSSMDNHAGRTHMSRRLPAVDRRSELVHRFGGMPPRVPSRMPSRVPSRAPSRQAMYYGYVVRRELQRHQLGTTAPRRRRRQHSYTGGKYGTCAVCHADIFNYVDYLNHLNSHRDMLEDANSFSCPMCLKKSISYQEIANSHATSHVDKDLHTCPVCKSHIFRKDNFRRHFTLRHPNELPVLTKYLSQYKRLVTNCLQRQAVKAPGPGPARPQGQASLGRQGDRTAGVGGPTMAFSQGFPQPVHGSPVQGDGMLMETSMANFVQRQLALSQGLGPPPQQPLGARAREVGGAREMHSPSSRPLPLPRDFRPCPTPSPPPLQTWRLTMRRLLACP